MWMTGRLPRMGSSVFWAKKKRTNTVSVVKGIVGWVRMRLAPCTASLPADKSARHRLLASILSLSWPVRRVNPFVAFPDHRHLPPSFFFVVLSSVASLVVDRLAAGGSCCPSAESEHLRCTRSAGGPAHQLGPARHHEDVRFFFVLIKDACPPGLCLLLPLARPVQF